jgi:hypothetical protein
MNELGDEYGSGYSWEKGFEERFRVALNMYNGRNQKEGKDTRYNWKYGTVVFEYAKQYQPH